MGSNIVGWRQRIRAAIGPEGAAVAIGLGVLLATQYRNLLAIPLVSDDYLILDKVQDASFRSLWELRVLLENYYRPWSRELHYWVIQRWFGLEPAAFHMASAALWLAALALFFAIVRRLTGVFSAVVATLGAAGAGAWGILLTWPAGAQDLWMIVAATASILAFGRGQVALSILACAVALLSKETAATLPAILALHGLLIDRRSLSDTMRRTSGHWILLVVWAALHPRLGGQLWAPIANPGQPISAHPGSVALRSALSPFNLDTWPHPEAGWMRALVLALPAVLVFGAIAALTGRRKSRSPSAGAAPAASRPRVVAFGAGWAVLGWLPLFAPGLPWHGYYAMLGGLGVWLALVTWIGPRPVFAVPLVMAVGLMRPARVTTPESDIGSEWYHRRIASAAGRIRNDLLTQHASMPSHSRVFFADVPKGVCLIYGPMDSPALRVWYRDRTLRGGFASHYTRRAPGDSLGRDYFIVFEGDSLTDQSSNPMLLVSYFYSMLLNDQLAEALRMLDLAIERAPDDDQLHYWRAWARLAISDSSGAHDDLEQAGIRPRSNPSLAHQNWGGADSDTSRRIAALIAARRDAGLEPSVHAHLAALWLASDRHHDEATIEAFAFRVLAPDDPDAWRSWAAAQVANKNYRPAVQSLERVQQLERKRGYADPEVGRVILALRDLLKAP